jgi:putative spermidine/putrescine transport system ATP-binding protein
MPATTVRDGPPAEGRPPEAGVGELRMEGVTRRFGEAAALQGLDLTIKGGEFIALLGPSGCGKTTALNCLAGLLPLSEGSIWLDDKRIDGMPPERRGFGMVFQNYALFPHLSVRRNVAFGLTMHGVGKQEAANRVEEALGLVGLEAHADKYPAQLSGGQQQRVAIARAVVMEPSLLLMDEPLSNLDAKLRLEMRTEIRRLHQQLGLTTIYVTHDQEEALSLADRLVLMRSGVVEQVGGPEEVYDQPVSAYVASFMGYRNMLELEVEETKGEGGGDGLLTVGAPGISLRGTDRRKGDGRKVMCAIRPEDLSVGGGENELRARVVVVEYRGHENAVEVVTPEEHVLHLLTDQRLVPGDDVTLSADPARVLVFDTEEAG